MSLSLVVCRVMCQWDLAWRCCNTPVEHSIGRTLISLSQAIEPVGGYTTESVTHGQCNARPTVTFPASEHHCPLAGTNLYYLVNKGTCVWTTCPRPRSRTTGTRICDLLVASPIPKPLHHLATQWGKAKPNLKENQGENWRTQAQLSSGENFVFMPKWHNNQSNNHHALQFKII